MRVVRIAPPRQLPLLPAEAEADAARVWAGLPEATREAVLAALARLIAKDSLDEAQARR